MIDFSELILRLKKLEKEYYDCMIKKDIKQALIASKELIVVSERIQAYTKTLDV